MMTFDEFERDWLRKHKAFVPRKQRVSSAREFFWIGFWVLVAGGAAVFSGSHTIPAAEMTIFQSVPNRDVLAITAFIIVELVIFGAAAGRHEIGWLKWLLLACVLVALVGNISSSARAVTENGGDALNQFGGVLLSIIAPITALAAGEVLHIQLDKRNHKHEDAQRLYDEKMVELQAKINTAYKRYEKDTSTVQPSKGRPMDVSIGQGYIPAASTLGHTKVPDASKRVQEFYEQNKDALWDETLGVRKVAEHLGVGRQTVSNVRQVLRDQAKQSNGHHVRDSTIENRR
jgi:hypothetical protein